MKLSIIVPIYNEERNIPEFVRQTVPIARSITPSFEIIFCMDPSTDQSEALVLKLREHHPELKLLRFSRRFGQPMATLAGLARSSGDAVAVMDVDLQDPPSLLPEMMSRLSQGYDVAYARRINREGETLVKRLIAYAGYRIIRRISVVPIPADTGDFRMMSRRVVDEVLRLEETHGFLRGMVALVGFRQVAVEFERPARFAGATKYNRFTGSLLIGLNGIICFSNQLLRLSGILGGMVLILAAVTAFVPGVPVSNRALLVAILAMGGLQLLSNGLLGAYIGRIYDEVRDRPRYIVDRAWGFD